MSLYSASIAHWFSVRSWNMIILNMTDYFLIHIQFPMYTTSIPPNKEFHFGWQQLTLWTVSKWTVNIVSNRRFSDKWQVWVMFFPALCSLHWVGYQSPEPFVWLVLIWASSGNLLQCSGNIRNLVNQNNQTKGSGFWYPTQCLVPGGISCP